MAPRGSMTRRGEIGRNEILVGVAVVAVLALIAVPVVWSTNRKSQREEVRINVDAIRLRELDNKAVFSEYLGADAAPRPPHAVDATPVPWVPTEGYRRLGWAPEQTEVRGAYSVTLTPDGGFLVRGACDVDGDGRRAIYEATADRPATLVTDAGIY